MAYFILAATASFGLYAAYLFFGRSLKEKKATRAYSVDITTKMYENDDEFIHISRLNPDLSRRPAHLKLGDLLYSEKSEAYTEASEANEQNAPALADFADIDFYLAAPKPYVRSLTMKPFGIARTESAMSGPKAASVFGVPLAPGATYILSRPGTESLTVHISGGNDL